MANVRHVHTRQAAVCSVNHSQVSRAECKRSPAFTQIKISRLESQAGPMSEDAMMDSSMDSHTALLPARQQSITEARSHVKEGLQAKQGPEPITFALRMRPSQNGKKLGVGWVA